MCEKAGEAMIAPITATATGAETSSVWCNRTDCPSYGKWYCPFTGW